MTVYIIDDNPSVSEALALLLQGHGYDVVCHPGAEGLFEEVPPTAGDVVFIDLMLPGISGGEIIRWLVRLKDPPRIIPMSALSRQFIEREMQNTGISQVLRKPLDQQTILAALATTQ